MNDYWKIKWNELAERDDIFSQTGRKGSDLAEFFLSMQDIIRALELKKSDTLLDIGGGAGLVSMYLSGLVKKITLIDYADKIVEKAMEVTKPFSNIEVFQDNFLTLKAITGSRFDKILVGSVLQYLENYNEVEMGFKNVFNMLLPKGRLIFTFNPDIKKRQAHIESYNRLAWSKEKINDALKIEERRLWLDAEKIKKIALRIGFSSCYEVPINDKIWESSHMFNLVLENK